MLPPPPGITNPKVPEDATKHFTFDYSYWSHTSVRTGGPGQVWGSPLCFGVLWGGP